MSIVGIDDKDIHEALDRIGRTPDGVRFYLFLQKTLTGVPPNPSADALREFHGRRMFAAELMVSIKDGILATNGGRDPAERAIVFVRADPVEHGRRPTIRERIAASDPELNPDAAGRKG